MTSAVRQRDQLHDSELSGHLFDTLLVICEPASFYCGLIRSRFRRHQDERESAPDNLVEHKQA